MKEALGLPCVGRFAAILTTGTQGRGQRPVAHLFPTGCEVNEGVRDRWSVVRPLSSIQHSSFKIAFDYAGQDFARFSKFASAVSAFSGPLLPPTLPPMSRPAVLFTTGRAL